MKVLQVNKKYFPWVGGVEKVVYDLCMSLKGTIDIQALVTSDTGKEIVENYEGVSVTRVPVFATLANTPVSFALTKKLSEITADIYHFHHPYPWGDLSFLIARPKGKIVVTYHSDIVRQKFLLKLYQPFMMRFLSKADKIVATSPNMIKYSSVLQKFKDKCQVIPIGIDANKFDAKNIDKNRVTGIKEKFGPKFVLFVGRLIYYKGIEYLINAMKEIDVNLVLVGSGPLKESLIKLSEEAGVRNRVFFVDALTDEELPAYYHACEVFVLPSIERTEAFGIVQLEAMASGKPVVSTNLSTGVPFVNKDGVTGYIVPPRSAEAISKSVNKILSDESLKNRLGMAGINRVKENFTIEIMAQKYLRLYQNI